MLISHFLPKPYHVFKIRCLPSVPLLDKNQLPREAGVYYAVRGWDVLYVGLSKNLYHRWNSYQFGPHHQLEALLTIDRSVGDVDIHYQILPDWLIGFEEALQIQRLAPRLNERCESLWENLNLKVIRLLAVKALAEFLLFVLLGLFLVVLIGAIL